MRIQTIYQHPSDYPGKFVRREWIITDDGKCEPGEVKRVSDTLDGAREGIDHGLILVPRFEGEDPAILECWI